MIVITGSIRIAVDKLAQARPLLQAFIEATRLEDGCLQYSFGEDVTDPGVMVAAEVWRDGEALGRHLNMPHFHAWREAGAGLGISDVNLTVYDVASSRPL